jgi:hypothetical protein
MGLLVWIKSHIDEILVILLTICIALLIGVTVLFVVLTYLAFTFPELFNKFSNGLGFAGVVLALGSFVLYFFDKLWTRNEKFETRKEKSGGESEFTKFDKKLDEILNKLNESK